MIAVDSQRTLRSIASRRRRALRRHLPGAASSSLIAKPPCLRQDISYTVAIVNHASLLRADTMECEPTRGECMALEGQVRSVAAANSSAVDLVTSEIRRAVLTGALPAGEQFSIRDLAAQLGVSHIPIREALRRLESQGLIVLRQARSASVAPLTHQRPRGDLSAALSDRAAAGGRISRPAQSGGDRAPRRTARSQSRPRPRGRVAGSLRLPRSPRPSCGEPVG